MCACVFLTLHAPPVRHCNILSRVSPLDLLLVLHTDLIIRPREALSPVGKEEIPVVGWSHIVKRVSEQLKRWAVFEGFVYVFRRLKLLCPISLATSGRRLGVVTSRFLLHCRGRTHEEGNMK